MGTSEGPNVDSAKYVWRPLTSRQEAYLIIFKFMIVAWFMLWDVQRGFPTVSDISFLRPPIS
jgi:hypothetical protein